MSSNSGFVAFGAAAAALMSSSFVFLPCLEGVVGGNVLPLAIVWSMLTVQPTTTATLSWARKSIVSAIISPIVGCSLACLGSQLQVRILIAILSFPIPLAYAMCDPLCNTPLQELMLPAGALVSHFIIVWFGPEEPADIWKTGLDLAISFTVGSTAGCISHSIITAILRRRESFCVTAVYDTLSATVDQLLFTAEGTLAYFLTGSMHRKDVEGRADLLRKKMVEYECAVGDWKEEWWSDKPATKTLHELQSALATCYAVQTGLLETFEDGYSDRYKQLIWEPITVQIEDLRLRGITALRLMSAWCKAELDEKQAATIPKAVQELQGAAGRFEQSLLYKRLDLHSEDEVNWLGLRHLAAYEVVRALAAASTLKRFATAVAELYDSLLAADIVGQAHRPGSAVRAMKNTCNHTRTFLQDSRNADKYFVSSPAEVILERGNPSPFKARARRFLKYPLRLVMTCHIASIILTFVAKELPEAKKYAVWALLPCILCFLPTTGAGFLKSFRRFLGTCIGGLVALGCIYWSPRNPPALVLELFIVTFAAKYASTFPFINYGGLTFGLTWHVVVLGNWRDLDLETLNGWAVPLWRIGMTSAGVALCMTFSMTLFPTHATRLFERACAEALLCTTEVCIVTSQRLLANTHSLAAGSRIRSHSEETDAWEDVSLDELEFSVRSSIPDRSVLLQEASAEGWFVPRIFTNLQAIEDGSEELAKVAAAMWRNSSLFDEDCQRVCARFFAAAPRNGAALRVSLMRLREKLRQATLAIAIQLRGVRAPGLSVSRRKVEHALHAVEHDFSMARQELWECHRMAELLTSSLDAVYATIYGLCAYTRVWIKLDIALKGSKQPGGRSSTFSEEELESQDCHIPAETSSSSSSSGSSTTSSLGATSDSPPVSGGGGIGVHHYEPNPIGRGLRQNTVGSRGPAGNVGEEGASRRAGSRHDVRSSSPKRALGTAEHQPQEIGASSSSSLPGCFKGGPATANATARLCGRFLTCVPAS